MLLTSKAACSTTAAAGIGIAMPVVFVASPRRTTIALTARENVMVLAIMPTKMAMRAVVSERGRPECLLFPPSPPRGRPGNDRGGEGETRFCERRALKVLPLLIIDLAGREVSRGA